MKTERPTIGVVGSHEPDYPRHLVLESALERRGYQLVIHCARMTFPWRHLAIARAVFGLPRHVKVIYATEGAHRLVPLIKLWAKLTGRKVLFDPFLSRYNTRVEDRKLYAPGSLQAKIAHWQDWSACTSADYLIFDTHEHRDYFYERYQLSAPSSVVPVGVPEETFVFPSDKQPAQDGPFEVLFYGTFIPLQGIETIVRACEVLPDGIRVTIIGKGQTWDEVMAVHTELNIDSSKLRFEAPVPFEALPNRLAQADIALGIFGATDKASRVVPNKVVQAAAMGRPMITSDTPAIRRYFEHESSIFLVPAGDAAALANAVLTLRDNPAMCARLGAGARAVFEQEFSLEAIADKMVIGVRHLEDE